MKICTKFDEKTYFKPDIKYFASVRLIPLGVTVFEGEPLSLSFAYSLLQWASMCVHSHDSVFSLVRTSGEHGRIPFVGFSQQHSIAAGRVRKWDSARVLLGRWEREISSLAVYRYGEHDVWRFNTHYYCPSIVHVSVFIYGAPLADS